MLPLFVINGKKSFSQDKKFDSDKHNAACFFFFYLFHMTDSFWGNWVRFNWNDTEFFFFIAKRERFRWGIFFNCNGGHFF